MILGIKWGKYFASYMNLNERYNKLRIVEYIDSSYASNIENSKLIIRYFFNRVIIT